MSRYSRSRAHQRIEDPATHHPRSVCLKVAAEFLGLDHRTLRKRIDLGQFPAWRDGKVYRINVEDLVEWNEQKRIAC